MSEIFIKSLEVHCYIGVPAEERSKPQRLLLDIAMEPLIPFRDMQDDLSRTADYDAAAQRITNFCTEKPRKLIETLAAEICALLLDEFPLTKATVEIRKFILPNTEYVSVRYTSRRNDQS